jgi:beta-lactamase regulating signal transducer with metallopeptidase domain
MGIGTSLFLIAAGAILRFAVTTTAQGLNINTIGVILMIVGGVGLLITMFYMTVWADRRRGAVAVDSRDVRPTRDPEAY